MKSRLGLWLIILLIIVAILVDLPFGPLASKFPLKLGLDLQGGTQLAYQANMDEIPLDKRDQTIESIMQVIERRVNPKGVSEAIVQKSKLGDKYRVIVEFPRRERCFSCSSVNW